EQIAFRIQAGVELGAFANPLANDGDLGFGQPVTAVFGRHPRATRRGDELVHQALFRLTWHDGLVLITALAKTLIGGHVELALALLGVMASETVFLENRGHIVDEADRSFGRRRLSSRST